MTNSKDFQKKMEGGWTSSFFKNDVTTFQISVFNDIFSSKGGKKEKNGLGEGQIFWLIDR